MRRSERLSNYPLEIVACDVSVGNSEHLKTRAFDDGRPGRVVTPPRLCVVRVTIHLQYDPRLEATKVHDETVQHMLAAKLEAEHAAVTQPRDVIGPPQLTPDGRTLYFTRRVTEADVWLATLK